MKRWQKLLLPTVIRIHNLLVQISTAGKLVFRQEWKKAWRCLIYPSPFDEIVIVYDKDGRKVEERYLSALLGTNRSTFAYDDKGNLTEEIAYSEGGYVYHQQSYEYEYDLHDNWIKKTTVYNFPTVNSKIERDVTVIFYRTIKYHQTI